MTRSWVAAIAAAMVVAAACKTAGFGPALPPLLAFDILRGNHRSIYRIRTDGSDSLQLTTDTSDNSQPTSAGSAIVFVSSRDGNAELYTMPASGGAPTRLTFTAANEANPALSPDGTKLAYTRDDGGLPRLWISDADGSNAARATDSLDFGGAVDASPTWAPGSDRIAFVSTTSGSARLYQLTLATMTIVALQPDTAAQVEPSWSPDGSRLAFVSGANRGARVAVLDLHAHAFTFITPASGQNGQPAWMPDGTVVFLQEGGTPALVLIDPSAPVVSHLIDVGAGTPGHPSAIKPPQ
ncbi:MAG TPA: hypothetical protein VN674_01815 [Gemmatimonadales bacterium]|nr:hypothetical protein [Gemmatimonadales bacterium]